MNKQSDMLPTSTVATDMRDIRNTKPRYHFSEWHFSLITDNEVELITQKRNISLYIISLAVNA